MVKIVLAFPPEAPLSPQRDLLAHVYIPLLPTLHLRKSRTPLPRVPRSCPVLVGIATICPFGRAGERDGLNALRVMRRKQLPMLFSYVEAIEATDTFEGYWLWEEWMEEGEEGREEDEEEEPFLV